MESRKFREQENPTRFVDLNAEERTRFGMTMKLYIIGNGFDIHHGIPSHYREFGKFLAAKDQETFDLVDRYFAVEDDFWFEFEDRLATFDADTLIEEASDFLASYATEDWSDAFHHDYEYEVGKVVKALSVTMKARFAEWISQLPIPEASAIEGKLIHLDPNATFLNFNYTPSLARLYSVPDANILHIHGSSKDLPENLVLGHGWSPQQKGSLNTGIDFEATDPRVMRGNEIIDQYFKTTFKPTDAVINRNQTFFRGLGLIEQIFVGLRGIEWANLAAEGARKLCIS
jgi:hypothetical protein